MRLNFVRKRIMGRVYNESMKNTLIKQTVCMVEYASKIVSGIFVFIILMKCNVMCAADVSLTNLTWTLSRYARIDGNLLVVDVPSDRRQGESCARARIDMSAFSGECFALCVTASCEGMSKPSHIYNGLKFQVHYKDCETGKDKWFNVPRRLSQHDFTMQTIMTVDPTLERRLKWIDIKLGLQGVSGKAVFDLSTLVVKTQNDLFPLENQDYRAVYSDVVKNRSRMRGVMLPIGLCTEDDFRTLHEWGATLARYQMTRSFSKIGANRDIKDYDRWLEGKLSHLERDVLPWAAKYGIKIVVDLHCTPGGRIEGGDFAVFHEPKYADHFVKCWKLIANRFKGRREIYGFDLVNEPYQKMFPVTCDYLSLQKRAAEAVRLIDPETPIIIESNMSDNPQTFAYLSPLDMNNIIYEVHMYKPVEFTHQQLAWAATWAGKVGKCPWPDKSRGWDKNFIRKRLAPVREFEQKHGVKIYVGEFSAVSIAEGASQYISDCISVFEEYGWDWTYHAFREAKCWSVEHEPDDWEKKTYKPSNDNLRHRALLDGIRGSRKVSPHTSL